MHERNHSCDIGAKPENVDGNIPIDPRTELEETAGKLGITPAKLKAMREYAIFLRRSDKRMKQSTVTRKIKEKFKIKLV
jgi:hypothetical protein